MNCGPAGLLDGEALAKTIGATRPQNKTGHLVGAPLRAPSSEPSVPPRNHTRNELVATAGRKHVRRRHHAGDNATYFFLVAVFRLAGFFAAFFAVFFAGLRAALAKVLLLSCRAESAQVDILVQVAS